MQFRKIPKYDQIKHWWNANDRLEVRLDYDIETRLHLVEADEQPEEIEDGCFYARVAHDEFSGLIWVREAEAFDLPSGITDADFVELYDGRMNETQHNVVHLNNDLQRGRQVKLEVVD